jgi:hypothetical protein
MRLDEAVHRFQPAGGVISARLLAEMGLLSRSHVVVGLAIPGLNPGLLLIEHLMSVGLFYPPLLTSPLIADTMGPPT